MAYEKLRNECLERGVLFEDPDFPAIHTSIYYSKKDATIQWKRPVELSTSPKFIVDGVSRFDLDQGSIGNCWYIAAAAVLACEKELFERVVPSDQGFTDKYAGIFHFYFWRYGRWVEVIIDDRLPTYYGRALCFCKNREEPTEFWSALLEKAYAKMSGSYESLEGGWTEDALVDFTGGIGYRQSMKDKNNLPDNFFKELVLYCKMNSLMGCSISASKDTMESVLRNGLVIGHAYSMTSIMRVNVKGKVHKLLRLRNPWGKKEWNGPWSDGSKEWQQLTPQEREKSGIVNDEDGEFWMSFEDWLANFQEMQVCHLPPDARRKKHRSWKLQPHDGSWTTGVSAGGCGNAPNADLYWSNPQIRVTLNEPDEEYEVKGKCVVVVSLMQKHGRLKRTYLRKDMANVPMAFDLYKVKEGDSELLDGENYHHRALQLARRGAKYEYYREITQKFEVDPGTYVIIPSTFQPNIQADFLLRILTEKDAESIEMDVQTGPIKEPVTSGDYLKELFNKYAGNDGVVDARELRDILNEAFRRELKQDNAFELEACRSLLAMMDRDQSGVLEFDEIRKMWAELTIWRETFRSFDKDKSGYIEVKELRGIFKSIGYSLGKAVLKSIVRRYGGKDGRLAFNDFVMVVTKIVVMMDIFAEHSKSGLRGKAEMSLDQWMQISMYF